MKKVAILALSFVLTLCLMTACGGRDTSSETSAPSTAATTKPTTAPTTATTAPTTRPSSAATTPSDTGMLEDGKIDGNGDAGNKSGMVGRLP